MNPKIIVCLLVSHFILLALIPINTPAFEEQWWNNNWSFRKEVILPIKTNTEIAKYQPIDIHIEFDNLCWAKNENEHSIRVVFQEGEYFQELDSQIYNLKYENGNYITSCDLVFLIPEFANGKENYFIYYDKNEKDSPGYEDHLSIEESYYYYEPIAGYPFESRYFKIIEDGFVVYAVSQEGEFMGYSTAQHITKLIEKTTEVLPKNGELLASFDFRYYYGEGMMDYSTTSEVLVSKEILVDGNLMVEFGIISKSSKDDIETTAIYKYYYCPSEHKRIRAHIKHNIFEELKVDKDANTDGVYAKLQCGGVTSKSIEDLNFGEILPYLHIYNENEMVDEYSLDLDPEFIPDDYDIRVLNKNDDIDLGTPPWASFDSGLSGESHSIILGSNNVLVSGVEEQDGIQIDAYELDYPHFPGIEADRAIFQLGRNSYENEGIQDIIIPEDFSVEFDAEFFSAKTGGYIIVQNEAEIFQSLVKIKPLWGEKFSDEIDKKEGKTLSIVVHFAQSFPLGAAFSAFTGKEFSYITVELYKEDELIYSGTPARYKFNSVLRDSNKLKWLISIFYPVDWKNLSIFKEISFQDIEPGRYLIKIIKENPFFSKERKYIGFKIIEVKEDTKTHVFCGVESLVRVTVVDTKGKAVEGSKVILLKDDFVIAENITDNSGQVVIKAPSKKNYDLRVLYKGFIIFDEQNKLRLLNRIIPIKKTVEIKRHDLKLKIVDNWGLPPTIELKPVMVSNEMDEPTTIYASKLSSGLYFLYDLIPAIYQLTLQYKSFSIKDEIEIPTQKEFTIIFPAEFNIKINILDTRGTPYSDAKIVLSREDKELNLLSKNTGLVIPLPPGVYNAKIYNQDLLVGSRRINVLGERSFDLITNNEPLFPYLVALFMIILALIALVFSFFKKNVLFFFKILSVSIATISITFPWWILNGASSQVETSTKMFLLPLELVTITTSTGIIGGELAYLPDLFVYAVSIIIILTEIGCFLILGSIIIKKFNIKLSYFTLVLALILLISSILIFSFAMSQLAEIGIGSFFGDGNLDVKIPGEDKVSAILCNWGPSTGFFLYLLSIVSLFITTFMIIQKKIF